MLPTLDQASSYITVGGKKIQSNQNSNSNLTIGIEELIFTWSKCNHKGMKCRDNSTDKAGAF